MRAMWDIFCRVIDNHGDLGVCLRLSRQLAASGHSVRLWVDEPSALDWMAPDLARGPARGENGLIRVLDWSLACDPISLAALAPMSHDSVWIEAFGCELPEAFVAHGVALAQSQGWSQPAWINLEYLSAEPWVERAHGLPSPILSGPAQGWVKRFFYPGFTSRTGGLLREPDLLAQQAAFDRAAHRMGLLGPQAQGSRLISLFCYEPAGLPDLLRGWMAGDHLLITPGRAMAAVHAAVQAEAPAASHGDAKVAASTIGLPLSGFEMPPFAHPLPHTDQAAFDRLLWACDLNLVRGEDSLVRALWAGQALVWHIYPQHDDAHHAKLAAFLDWLQAPPSLRRFHAVWNGIEPGPLPALRASDLLEWQHGVGQARERLLAQTDLLGQLKQMARTARP